MHPRDPFPDLSPTDLADVIENVLARKQAGQKISLQDIPSEPRPPGSVPPRSSAVSGHPAGCPNRQSEIDNRQSARPRGEQTDSFVQQTNSFEENPSERRCAATTKFGAPCRTPPLVGSDFCLNHDPDYAGQQHENVRNGGVASGKARRPLLDDASDFTLSDRTSVQAAIDAILRLELTGKIPPSRSRVIVRLLSLAVRNFDRPKREGYYDAVVATHDPATYAQRRHALDTRLSDIVQALEGDELNRRVWAIADVGSKRQEYLKANDLFSPPTRRRATGPGYYDE